MFEIDRGARELSGNPDLVELRDLEFLRGAAGQDRELVQREFVLVIAAGDEAVYRNHAQKDAVQVSRYAALLTLPNNCSCASHFSPPSLR
jgi:hypothetical protein